MSTAIKTEQSFLQWLASKIGMKNADTATPSEVQQAIIDANQAHNTPVPAPAATEDNPDTVVEEPLHVEVTPSVVQVGDETFTLDAAAAEITRLRTELATATARIAELEQEPAAAHTDGVTANGAALSATEKEIQSLGKEIKALLVA